MKKTDNSVLLATAYLPPISWFYQLLNHDVIFIEQFESYPKQTFRNRAIVYSGNGELNLTVPVTKPDGNGTITQKIEISNTENWQKNHWKAISTAYLNSPYFEYYCDELEEFYQKKQENLLQFDLKLIDRLNEILGIKKEIQLTKAFEFEPNGQLDLRTKISPKLNDNSLNFPEYIQVFSDVHGFKPNLSIIDLLFNLGPDSLAYLKSLHEITH